MTPEDLRLRRLTYALVPELGHVPTAALVAARAGTTVEDVRAGWLRLHDAHAVVLDPTADELAMLNPFAARPTAHRVHAAGRDWWANCAWDAFGVCAALGVDGEVHTLCPDCGEHLVVAVRDGRSEPVQALFHCLVPAARWWDDIAFT